MVAPHALERLFAIPRENHVMTIRRQQPLEETGVCREVVHHQYGGSAGDSSGTFFAKNCRDVVRTNH